MREDASQVDALSDSDSITSAIINFGQNHSTVKASLPIGKQSRVAYSYNSYVVSLCARDTAAA